MFEARSTLGAPGGAVVGLLVGAAFLGACSSCGGESTKGPPGTPSAKAVVPPASAEGPHDQPPPPPSQAPAPKEEFTVPDKVTGTPWVVVAERRSVRVDGTAWRKSLPKDVLKRAGAELRQATAPRVVMPVQKMTRKEFAFKAVGLRGFSKVQEAVGAALDLGEKVHRDDPALRTLEVKIREGVPFWFVAFLVNALFWEDRIDHLELALGDARWIILPYRPASPRCEGDSGQARGLTLDGDRAKIATIEANAESPLACPVRSGSCRVVDAQGAPAEAEAKGVENALPLLFLDGPEELPWKAVEGTLRGIHEGGSSLPGLVFSYASSAACG
ncbi:MAG: hypothetical protein KC416_02760 [Myxococcales bacterium]|nr:hypothetical protein [Myxococcales bacterium]